MLDQRKIDFLIIGAQKSGTTSLFRYLSEHPAIFMPPQKEVEFFNDDDKFLKGIEWFLSKYFAKADTNQKLGEASTHNMMYFYVPERIFNTMPDVKLIALLRNPIDRAYSHYRMAVRRGLEHRSFEKSIIEGIAIDSIDDNEINHNFNYVQFGEYGRILNNYLSFFDKKQIHICFSENLKNDTTNVIKKIFQFIHVDDSFLPQNSKKIYHKSGEQYVPGLTRIVKNFIHFLRRQKTLSPLLWRVNFDALFFWLDTQFNIKKKVVSGPSVEAKNILVEHYSKDILLLEKKFDIEVPWKDFKVKSR